MSKLKKGNTVATYPLIVIISIISIIIVGTFFVNSIFPFIWYQKLNSTAQKYMFVIEKFGYLTNVEKNNLIKDLTEQGFDQNYIEIYAPEQRRTYGELIEFKLIYKYKHKNVGIINNIFSSKDKYINMQISKNSYSKI